MATAPLHHGLLLTLVLWRLCHGTVLSPAMDKEVAELHASLEEGFQTLASFAGELKTSPDRLSEAQKLEADFKALQGLAFKIGQESRDNAELIQHGEINNYIQSLREFRPRLQALASKLKQEFPDAAVQVSKTTGKAQAKKTNNVPKVEDVLKRARKTVAQDTRVFKTKAMDLVSIFQERQLAMQDKQRDMQREMDGPDWPKEDWPLSTADAKNVGEVEDMIQGVLAKL